MLFNNANKIKTNLVIDYNNKNQKDVNKTYLVNWHQKFYSHCQKNWSKQSWVYKNIH